MTSLHNPRRALIMSAVTILVAVGSGNAAAGHRHDHADVTMTPGGDPAAHMSVDGAMDMPMDHEGSGGHGTAMGADGDHAMPNMSTDGAMSMPMDDEGSGEHGTATHDGDAMGAHGGHTMPDMQTMGALASNVHEVHLAATQRVLAHKTTIYALLVALGIDRGQNSALLRQAQGQFEQVQAGLRDGDAGQGLDGLDNSAMRVELQTVDIYWSRYDAVIQQILDQPALAVEHITMLTVTDADLHRSLKRMAEAVEHHSYEGRGYSILLPTVRHAQHLSAMVQELAAEFLLVAYGHDMAASEQALRDTAAEFDLVLDALTNGNHELHVLGAPTPEILAQYDRVRGQWQRCWSAIESMSTNHRLDPGMIDAVLTQVERVAVEVDVAVGLYHFL